mmetsp:Transcript_58446/g.142931  ORF Transcript_58446/g.142931 Transcript_58446/m.142931 type:complete len:291 (+) Transcript_58446:478-1350(+)
MEVHHFAHPTDCEHPALVLHQRNERNCDAEFCENRQGPIATNILDFTILVDVPNYGVCDVQTIIVRILRWIHSTSIVESSNEIVELEWWVARCFVYDLSFGQCIALVAIIRITCRRVSCNECRIHVRESISHTSHQTTGTIRNFVVVTTSISRRELFHRDCGKYVSRCRCCYVVIEITIDNAIATSCHCCCRIRINIKLSKRTTKETSSSTFIVGFRKCYWYIIEERYFDITTRPPDIIISHSCRPICVIVRPHKARKVRIAIYSAFVLFRTLDGCNIIGFVVSHYGTRR